MFESPRPVRLPVILLLLAAALLASGSSAYAWTAATHSRDAKPDYGRVFPSDRVNRLDIRIASADWKRLVDDMTDMAGKFGEGKRIDPAAVAACAGKVDGNACSFGNPLREGRCHLIPEGPLACLIIGGPSNPDGGDDAEFLPRTPVYIPATVKFDGVEFHHVGLRLKGNSSLVNSWSAGVEKLPLRLNFDELEEQFPKITDQTFFGFPNISLTNNGMDPSFMRAKVVSDLLAETRIPSPRAAYVRVYLDRGEGPAYWGLYTMVEVPDRPLLEKYFGSDDGNLYKPQGKAARWTEFDPKAFRKQTNAAAEDWTDIQDAIAALHDFRKNPASARARFEARFDVDTFLRWLAFNTIVGNSDAYGGFIPHNYYLYGSPRHRDRLFWIPWDHDLAFESGAAFLPPPNPGPPAPPLEEPPIIVKPPFDLFHRRTAPTWPLIRFLLDDPTYVKAYRKHVEEIMSTLFVPERLAAKFRADHALIARYVTGAEGEQPGRTFLRSPDEFAEALNGPFGLVKYVHERHEEVRRALAEEP